MAWLRPNPYRWAVAGKSILDLAMVSLWIQGEPLTDGLWAVAGLTSLYVLAPEWFIRHSKSFTPWAILQAGGAFAIFLMSYYALPNPDSTFLPTEWGLLALMFALLAISKAAVWRESVHMLTIYAIATLSFLSLGLTILLDADWLPLAFALQSLGVVWIAHKTGLSSLNTVLKLALIVFTISVMGQILLFTNVIIFSFFQTGPEFFAWQIPGNPLLQLGIPLLAYLIASHLAIRSNVIIPFLAKYMALIATGLGAATIYYLVRGAFVDDGMPIFQEPASFWARGCITLVFIIAAELTRILAPRVQTFPLATASSALLHIALFRIVYFDILTLNPFFHDTQNVGSLPLLNAVTMVYGAGLFASLRMVRTHSFYKILSGILLLTLVSLTIRQLFHGEHLDYIDSNMSHTEFYSYSIMWLVTGLGLLTYGVMRNNKSCRIAALGFLLLTIGKVFIFDASVLEGLMRVFSFLGLGVSLIGLSMVYTRFMNTKTDTE